MVNRSHEFQLDEKNVQARIWTRNLLTEPVNALLTELFWMNMVNTQHRIAQLVEHWQLQWSPWFESYPWHFFMWLKNYNSSIHICLMTTLWNYHPKELWLLSIYNVKRIVSENIWDRSIGCSVWKKNLTKGKKIKNKSVLY